MAGGASPAPTMPNSDGIILRTGGAAVLRPYMWIRDGGRICSLWWGGVYDLFGGGVPVEAFAGPVGVAGHHDGDGVGEAVVYGGVGLFS